MKPDFDPMPINTKAFIAVTRRKCRNSINNTAAGRYLNETLMRLEDRELAIDQIREYLQRVIGLSAKNDHKEPMGVALAIIDILDRSEPVIEEN